MSEERQKEERLQRIIHSQSYRLAYEDPDFLTMYELRPMRMQMELLKPELAFERYKIRSTIVVFGSTRIIDSTAAAKKLDRAKARLADTPGDVRRQRALAKAERLMANSRYYAIAQEFGRIVSSASQVGTDCEYVIVTGGGPGVMEAANRGAYECGAKSVGLNIHLPQEQDPNSYITPELCFQFRYFAMRKVHFLLRAKALVVFPGGFGTMDELFEVLTLRQTGRMQHIPVILFGREFWEKAVNFQFFADEGTVDDEDLDLFRFAETAEEAWEIIRDFHRS